MPRAALVSRLVGRLRSVAAALAVPCGSLASGRARRSFGFVVLLAAACGAGSAAAGAPNDPWHSFEQPRFTTLTSGDGLPDNSVSAVVQDASGFVWMGTSGGLARHDGLSMQVIRPEAGNGLPDGYIRALLALDDGRLLVGTNNAGLLVLEPDWGRFTPIPLGAELDTNAKIFALRAAADGGVWVASSLGLDRFDPATGSSASVALRGFPAGHSPRIFDVAEDAAGRLWLGANPGLFVRAAGGRDFERVSVPGARADGVVWRLHVDSSGRLWVGTDTRGAFAIRADGSFLMPPALRGATGLTHANTVRDFVEGDDGRLWIATYGSGIIVCEDRACADARAVLMHSGDSASLAGNLVRALTIDASGTLWAGTLRGASRASASRRAVFLARPPRPTARQELERSVTAILVDRQQRIWLSLQGIGIGVLDLGSRRLRMVALPPELARQTVTSLVQSPGGTVWAGSLGVLGIDPVTLQIRTRIRALAEERVTSLMTESHGLVIGTYNGAFLYDSGEEALQRVEYRDATDGWQPAGGFNDSVVAGTRRWYAFPAGLAVGAADGGILQLLRAPAGRQAPLSAGYTSMLALDAKRQRLWVASEAGLAWLNPGAETDALRLHPVPGTAALPTKTVVLDDDGNAWGAGDGRVVRVDAATLSVRHIRRVDGLPAARFNLGVGSVGSGDALLFGTDRGLVVVRPSLLASASGSRGPLQVGRLSINGQRAPLGRLADGVLKLDNGERNVDIGFALLDFRAPRSVRYAYRLVGFDRGWQRVADGARPHAVYTNLASGTYRLQLRATPEQGPDSAVYRTLSIEVAPYWYETWSARVLLGLALLLLALALVYAGLRWSRRRQRLLDALIAQRTHELRLANARLQQLATTDTLTGLDTRGRFMESAGNALADARRTDAELAILLLDLDRFKQVNDRHGHLAGDAVLAACGAFIRENCRAGDIAGRYGGEEIVLCLPGTGAGSAYRRAEQLRAGIAALRLQHGSKQIAVTCSIGVAVRGTGDEALEALLSRADGALYAGKSSGRDRVELAAPAVLSVS